MKRSSTQLWEVWPGKNRFYCKGKLITGPKSDLVYYLPCVTILFIFPISFLVVIAPYIWTNVACSLPILFGLLFLNTVAFFFITGFTEPGIIPRKCVVEAITLTNSSVINDLMRIDMNKFCSTCQIYKTNRSHHCKSCDNCVEIFDHHCPYINNCIGGRNYAYFFIFVVSLTLLTWTEILGCFIFIFHNYEAEGPDKSTCKINVVIKINSFPLAVSIILIVAITMLAVIATILCLHHVMLCCTGETTKERIKGGESKAKCYFIHRKPTKFNLFYELNEDQTNKIQRIGFELDIISESEASESINTVNY